MEPLFQIIYYCFCFALAAFVQGFGGFGLGIMAMTLLVFLPVHMERLTAITSINMLFIFGFQLFLTRMDHQIHYRKAFYILAGLMVGTPIGYWTVSNYGDQPIIRLIFGIVLLYYAMNAFYVRQVHRKIPLYLAPPIGIFSGWIGGAFVSGGPPIVLYLYSQVKDPREMKATIQFIFVLSIVYRIMLIGFGDIGFTPQIIKISLLSVPAAIFTLILGHRLSKRFSAETFRICVYVFIAIFGAFVFSKAIFDLS